MLRCASLLMGLCLVSLSVTGCQNSVQHKDGRGGATADVVTKSPAPKTDAEPKPSSDDEAKADDKPQAADSDQDDVAGRVTLTSPTRDDVLQELKTTLEGTCVGDDDVVVAGDVEAAPVTAKCEDGKFSASVTLAGADAKKNVKLSQPTNESVTATDNELHLTYCSDVRKSSKLADGKNGKGASEDPFLLCSAKQLDELRNSKAAYAKLMVDIDLGVAPFNTGAGWAPIGTPAAPYKGTFDGQGREIKSLSINNPTFVVESQDHPTLSFFGTVDGGKIKNLVFRGARVKAYREGAVVAGWLLRDSLLENVSVEDGSVEAETSSGGVLVATGVVGANDKVPTLRNLSFAGTIKVKNQAGGILTWLNHGTLTGCRVTGSIQGDTALGGAVNYMLGDATHKALVSSCRVEATITATAGVIGGVIATASANSIIERNAFTGSIESTGGSAIGGILAVTSGASGSEIRDCYATALLKGSSNVGGILGSINFGQIVLKRSYYAGNATTTTATRPPGGIIGTVEFAPAYTAGSWAELYFDTTVSPSLTGIGFIGPWVAPNPLPMTGKTTAQLGTKSTYAGWDFDKVWTMPVEGGRPVPRLAP